MKNKIEIFFKFGQVYKTSNKYPEYTDIFLYKNNKNMENLKVRKSINFKVLIL